MGVACFQLMVYKQKMQQKTKGYPVVGEWFEFYFNTNTGIKLEMAGLVHSSSTTNNLVLTDIMIFMATGGLAKLGNREILRCRSEFVKDIKNLGFSKVSISGVRVTGAHVGKIIHLTFP